jgi:predicted nucleic acid-binding protein
VYAYNADAPSHEAARQWWERVLSEDDPLAPAEALAMVRSWVERPSVQLLEPGRRQPDH